MTAQSETALGVSLADKNPKNYLLVPLARDGGAYRLDFEMVDKVIDR